MSGYPTPYEDELRARVAQRGLERDVRIEGWLPDDAIEGLWGVADGFVYPSLWEGFGLPVLEAMARGVPVACSNASSLPEVAGDAALLFDPRDVHQMAVVLRRLLAGGPDIERLREAGHRQAAQFTWQKTAERTVHSYRRALQPSP
jgi:glycosyltransferase involved in cell wall biosynthesis